MTASWLLLLLLSLSHHFNAFSFNLNETVRACCASELIITAAAAAATATETAVADRQLVFGNMDTPADTKLLQAHMTSRSNRVFINAVVSHSVDTCLLHGLCSIVHIA